MIHYNSDQCNYKKYHEDERFFSALYVDDMVVASKLKANISFWKTELTKLFDLKNLGSDDWLLGMSISYDLHEGMLSITQPLHAEYILNQFKMDDCKAFTTPMKLQKCTDDSNGTTVTPFQSAIESLLCMSTAWCPVISFSSNY